MERPRFKPRAVMEMAIQAMHQYVAESRSDGKAMPKVGAVLVKPGPSQFDTAYRGEIRDGDGINARIIRGQVQHRQDI